MTPTSQQTTHHTIITTNTNTLTFNSGPPRHIKMAVAAPPAPAGARDDMSRAPDMFFFLFKRGLETRRFRALRYVFFFLLLIIYYTNEYLRNYTYQWGGRWDDNEGGGDENDENGPNDPRYFFFLYSFFLLAN